MSAERPPPAGGTAEGAAYADRFAAETPEMVAARAPGRPPARARRPCEPAVGATLAVLAAGVEARSVVSIGSGGGLAGLWLLRGMRTDGVLTALDGDPEQLRAARKAFAEAGIAAGRARLIFGTPAEVLPRLSPGAYDLVVCAGPPREYADAPGRPARPGPGRRHAGLPRPARRRPDRRPHRARPADRRLAGDRPHDPRGRDAAVRRPADRRRPAGRHQSAVLAIAGSERALDGPQTMARAPLPSTVTPPALTW